MSIGCVMMKVMAHLNCCQKVQSSGRHVTIGIKEEKPTYTKHDMLFKQLIQNFFDAFLELFFPNIYKRINLKTIEFLSEEMFTDIVNGTTRRLDIVVQAKLNKEDTLIIIHIEPQSYEQRNFNERMFQYYSFLYNEHRLPIIPIAVFSYDENWDEDEFSLEIMNVGLVKFRYLTLHLRKMDWRKFIRADNPVAAALLSKMGYTEEERVQVKIEFLRMLIRLNVNSADQRLLYGFFESYLKLNETEEERFMAEARKFEEAEEILEIPISYEEKGKEIGRKEGRLKEKIDVAQALIKEGVSKDIIMKTTKLSLTEIERLEQKTK